MAGMYPPDHPVNRATPVTRTGAAARQKLTVGTSWWPSGAS